MVKTAIAAAMGVGKWGKASELRRTLLGGPSALLVDPLGFDAGDSNLYRYVNNGPVSGKDPSGFQEQTDWLFQEVSKAIRYTANSIFIARGMKVGLLEMDTIQIPNRTYEVGKFEQFAWTTKWRISDRKKSGFVIQHVIREIDSGKFGPEREEIWEGWQVIKGIVYAGYAKTKVFEGTPVDHVKLGGRDEFGVTEKELGDNEIKKVKITGYTKFVEGIDVDWTIGSRQAGVLPATIHKKHVPWWNDNDAITKIMTITTEKINGSTRYEVDLAMK
jgi:hypothetical protein